MSDWIETAARHIYDDQHYDGPRSVPDLIDIIRQHAPQWRDRPTCAGWWVWSRLAFDGTVLESGMFKANEDYYSVPGVKWFGPIPEPPKEQP